MQARTLGFAAALAVTALAPVAAMAQVRDFTTAARRGESLPKTEARSDDDEQQTVSTRSNAPVPTEAKVERAFIFLAPFAYNSNPTQVTTGEDSGEHITPTAILSYERTSAKTENVLTIEAVAQADDYFGRKDADQSVGVLSITYQFGNSAKDLAPYLNYERVEICAGKFESCKLSLDIATAGLAQEFSLGGAAELSLKVWGGRRFSNIAEVELNRVGLTAEAKGLFLASEIIWKTKHELVFQSYTGGASDGRDDVNYKGELTFLKPIGSDALLGLTLQLERNDSDVVGRDFTAWDFGPRLILQRPF